MDGDMNALLARLLDEAEGGGQTVEKPPGETSSVPSNSGGSEATGGGNPLANPALLAALPVLAENLRPLMGGSTGSGGGKPREARPVAPDRHTALLCAIKPYLSPRRREAAETVIRLCRVWDALEKAGISPLGMLGGMGHTVPTGQDVAPFGTGDKEVT